MLIGTILFFVGIGEEFINILYYKVGQKNYKYACGFFQMIRVFIWYYVLRTIVENLSVWYLVFFYALGGSIGDYLSLTFEPYLEKKIIWIRKLLKKKGRYKKRWFLWKQGKTRR